MSSPRYDWWGYVKGMIRRFPKLKSDYIDALDQKVTATYDGKKISMLGGDGRPVEQVVERLHTQTWVREFMAVDGAVADTEHMRDGRLRLDFISLVFWKRSHTLSGAAAACHVSPRTARRYHSEFIFLVAKNFGLLTPFNEDLRNFQI